MKCSFVWQLTLSQYFEISCLAIYLCFHKVKAGSRNIMQLPVIISYLPTQRSKIPLAYWVEEDKGTLLNQSEEARMDMRADYLLHEIFPFLIPNNLSKEQIPSCYSLNKYEVADSILGIWGWVRMILGFERILFYFFFGQRNLASISLFLDS